MTHGCDLRRSSLPAGPGPDGSAVRGLSLAGRSGRVIALSVSLSLALSGSLTGLSRAGLANEAPDRSSAKAAGGPGPATSRPAAIDPGLAASRPAAGGPGPVETHRAAIEPALSWGLDLPLLGAGAALSGLSTLVRVHHIVVPPQGLARSRIQLALDRSVVGNYSEHAANWSNLTQLAASAFPFGLAFVSAPKGSEIRDPLLRVVPFLEATGLNEGITSVLKRGISRPRPYLYLPGSPLSNRGAADEGLLSFPSGHSSHSWCAASFAVVDHLLSRPQASWQEDAAVGLAGGFLAASTSYLRVRAGQHFPSDVIGGGLIGSACGAGVPLLHRYMSNGRKADWPDRTRCLSALAGVGLGVLIVSLAGPSLAPH